jgi:hydroxymethylbilane synthase
MRHLTLGTRGSALALAQTELVLDALERAWPETAVTIRKFTTSGDRKVDLAAIKATPAGAKGLFTKELEEALLKHEIDVAVHSCKDMPGTMPDGLTLAAVLPRADTSDVLITKAPGELPEGAHVATSSVRRARQLAALRPDLVIEEIRGNVATRLRKLRQTPHFDGTVLARAGLDRLGYQIGDGRLNTDEGEFFAVTAEMLPAIGQGAIALQCRLGDAGSFAALNHEPTWLQIRAERELMRLLNGDCRLPVGVSTEVSDGSVRLQVVLFGTPEEPPRRADVTESTPEEAARTAFEALQGNGRAVEQQ